MFFDFFSINRISTEFFFKYKKISKMIFNIFLTFSFEKFFFGENFFYRIFFGETFSFHKNISAKIFFTICSRISFVFDLYEIMYFAKFFIRIFAYCEFFCFAIVVYGKKNCKFFFVIFFSTMNMNTKFENVSFLKKVKFSLIVLLDFFIHY